MAINAAALSLIHPGLGASIAGFLPDVAQVRRKIVSPLAPVTDLTFGYGPAPGQTAPANDFETVAELRCAKVEAGEGKQNVIVDGVETIVPWRVKFRSEPKPDVRVGDVLVIGGDGFKVVSAPVAGSFSVLCSAGCQECKVV